MATATATATAHRGFWTVTREDGDWMTISASQGPGKPRITTEADAVDTATRIWAARAKWLAERASK